MKELVSYFHHGIQAAKLPSDSATVQIPLDWPATCYMVWVTNDSDAEWLETCYCAPCPNGYAFRFLFATWHILTDRRIPLRRGASAMS